MNASTITSVTRDMDAVKRDMEIKILSATIKLKVKQINNAHQRIVAREKRVFMETIGVINWSWNDQRVYMEGRNGYIRKETLLEKAKIIRSIYLMWLRSVSFATSSSIARLIPLAEMGLTPYNTAQPPLLPSIAVWLAMPTDAADNPLNE